MITGGVPTYAKIAKQKAAAVAPSFSNRGAEAGAPTQGIAASSIAANAAANLGAKPPATATTSSVAPYLTAAQIAAYTNAVQKDQATINGAAGARGTLTNKFDTESAVNGAKAQTSFNNTNQSDAARGFGFSGIHDNAMSDIQANAVMNQNNYNTAYKIGLSTLATNVTGAQNDIGQLGLEYGGIAGENAQTLATANGATVNPSPYQLPAVTAAPVAGPINTPAPVTYFNNPNMGAINTAIGAGAGAGTAAGAPS